MIYQFRFLKKLGAWNTTILFIFLILSYSCTSEKSQLSKKHISEKKSCFISELSEENYIETKVPTFLPTFKWDFSKKEIFRYKYKQVVKSWSDFGCSGDDSDKSEHSMSAKGALLIKSNGDSTADLVLKDVKMSAKIISENNDQSEVMEQKMPVFVIQGMKEDGSGLFGNSSQSQLLKMLFPLPTKSLDVGESDNVPARMHFNAMGSQLIVKGFNRITLKRYVKIAEATCAQLDVNIDISNIKVPEELKGEYKCSAKGASIFYFDVNRRCLVFGSTALLMQASIDAPMPKVKIPREKSDKTPERSKMSIISDNLIRVNLVK